MFNRCWELQHATAYFTIEAGIVSEGRTREALDSEFIREEPSGNPEARLLEIPSGEGP